MNRRSFFKALAAIPLLGVFGRFAHDSSDAWGKTLTKADVDGWEAYSYAYRNSVTGCVSNPVPCGDRVHQSSLEVFEGTTAEIYCRLPDGSWAYVETRGV